MQQPVSGSSTARDSSETLRVPNESGSPTLLAAHESHGSQLLGATYRATTLGMVGLVSLIALEALAVATVMPQAATALEGLSLYGFAFGGPLATSMLGMVAAGRWSDRDGPMRPLWAGVACFVAGLVIGGVAPAMAWLLLGRLVSGLGAGLMSVALYALVGRVYPTSRHAQVFTSFSAAWVLPSLVGPALSGLVAEAFGWRWSLLGVALLTLPAAVLLTRIALPQTPALRRVDSPKEPRRLLWASSAVAGVLALHYFGQGSAGPSAAREHASTAWWLMPAALALLLVAARRLLPPGTLAARRGLPAAIGLNGLAQAAFFAAEAFLPLLLFRERGMSVGMAGLVLSAGAVSWSAGAACRGVIGVRFGTVALLRIGMTMLAVGIALPAAVLLEAAPVAIAIAGWAIAGAGMGLISPTLSVLTLALSRPERQGEIGASLRLSAALSITSALALSGALFTLLLPVSTNAAYVSSLGLAAALALLGAAIADRATPGTVQP